MAKINLYFAVLVHFLPLAQSNQSYLYRELTAETRGVIDYDVGQHHICVLDKNSELFCIGDGSLGQLGSENTANQETVDDSLLPVDVGDGLNIKSVHTGWKHTCVILESNDLKCFGNNEFGQLGYGNTSNIGSFTGSMGNALPIVDLGQNRKVKKFATGQYHSCAILDTDQFKCWGKNDFMQLGYSDILNRGDNDNEMGDNLPALGNNVKDITVGERFTCILLTTSEMKCFGGNSHGNLGLGDKTNRMYSENLPSVNVGGDVKIIKALVYSTCAVLNDNKIKCWGDNYKGCLGLGSTVDTTSPTDPIDIGSNETVEELVTGRYGSCFFLGDKSVKCIGRNNHCELGSGIISSNSIGDEPGELGDKLATVNLGSREVKDIRMGPYATCVKFLSDEVACWGTNKNGMFGTSISPGAKVGCDLNQMGNNLQLMDVGNFKYTSTPSTYPSFIPSLSSFPSLSPSVSTMPSLQPSERDEWYLSFVNSTTENALDSFQLEYSVAKDKNSTQFISSIYDSACEKQNNDTSISISNKTLNNQENVIYDQGIVTVILNGAQLKNSSYWRSSSSSYEFCVRTELLSPLGTSVTFVDTRIRTTIDLEAGFTNFEIRDVNLAKNDVKLTNHFTELEITACICNELKICEQNTVLRSNEEFNICVTPLYEGVIVAQFNSVRFFQDGISKLDVVMNGENIYHQITTIISGPTGVVQTRLSSDFFISSNPSDLFIEGTVVLEFSGSRRLGNFLMKDFEKKQNHGMFELAVNLSNLNENETSNYLLISLFIFTLLGFVVRRRNSVNEYTRLEISEEI